MKEALRLWAQRMGYKLRYWKRVLCHTLGFCPKCGKLTMVTRNGTVFCPYCGGR